MGCFLRRQYRAAPGSGGDPGKTAPMPASTPARRRLLLGAVVVLALASLVSNFPTAAAQTTPDGRTDAGPVTFEDDVAPVHITEVPADLLPPSMRPDAQAASVEPIQPWRGTRLLASLSRRERADGILARQV